MLTCFDKGVLNTGVLAYVLLCQLLETYQEFQTEQPLLVYEFDSMIGIFFPRIFHTVFEICI